MHKTEFLMGRSGLDLQDDFYPDDLPQDWRFDYYTAIFKTLSLAIDTDEDLKSILNATQVYEKGDFVLVLTIEYAQLIDTTILKQYLSAVQNYAANFVLFCEVEKAPSEKIMTLLSDYKICFQSSQALSLDLQAVQVLDITLNFNQYPVIYTTQQTWNEKQMRAYLESIGHINTKTILICKFAQREILDKMRIIAELLGF